MNRHMQGVRAALGRVPHASGDEPERGRKIVKSCNPTLKKAGGDLPVFLTQAPVSLTVSITLRVSMSSIPSFPQPV